MRQLVYRSTAVIRYDRNELIALMARARKFNAENDVTGVLFFHRGLFAQCIEGPSNAIDAVWKRIERDQTHRDVVVLQDLTGTARSFSQWAMACTEIDEGHWLALEREKWGTSEDRTLTPGLVTMQAIWKSFQHAGI